MELNSFRQKLSVFYQKDVGYAIEMPERCSGTDDECRLD